MKEHYDLYNYHMAKKNRITKTREKVSFQKKIWVGSPSSKK